MTRSLWPLLVGFMLWAIAFIALYGLQYLGCYFGWPAAQHRAALIAGYLLTLMLLAGWLFVQARRLRSSPSATAMERMSVGTTLAALVATVITFGPVVFASMCI